MTVKDPPRDLLREWFSYDPKTGVFVYLKEPCSIARTHLGKIAGTMSPTGYRRISIPGFKQRNAGRMAWIYSSGPIPEGLEVDHIDGDPTNDRLENLRLATSSQQKQNRKCQTNNRSGLRGAFYHACRKGKKWRSQIKVGSRLVFLGYFQTPEEASDAHFVASQKYFGEFHSDRFKL